jgi:MoxR-like ATPase
LSNQSFNNDKELVEQLNSSVKNIKSEIAKIIIGQEETINNLLVSILAKGHCLLVGVPGLAKTLLIKTFAEVLDLEFNRIQFTPDLMPSDITGTEIIEEDQTTKQRSFKFIRGPIFANIILADEINRTPPKTQAALLEAMQEHRVTAAGNTYKLDEPFFVLATQNPIEQEGTYPLPEAQLDRFMFNLWLDYPSLSEEIEVIKSTTSDYNPSLSKALAKDDLIKYQELVRRVPVAENVIEYAVRFVSSTRPSNDNPNSEMISWGAGPRASQYLILAAKTKAIMDGRFTPEIDDVKSSLNPVLRHRIIPTFNAEAEGITSLNIIKELSKV